MAKVTELSKAMQEMASLGISYKVSEADGMDFIESNRFDIYQHKNGLLEIDTGEVQVPYLKASEIWYELKQLGIRK